MSDRDDTPADSPYARRRKSLHEMDTRISGTNEDMNGGAVHLSRNPPELEPLPLNPSAHDVAVRYGSDSAFLRQQWPRLVQVIEGLQGAVRTQQRAHWGWPLATGILVSLVFSLAVGLGLAMRAVSASEARSAAGHVAGP